MVRSGDGAIDSYTLQGGKKADVAANGKDVDHRSVTCERAGQLHGPYANRPGPITTRLGPAQMGNGKFGNSR